ncbi:MAG: aldo/keto reductase [Alphaproteobacteria bacterium]|nr:aldo/keto reductase [Alphaproteobacteria bacterium]
MSDIPTKTFTDGHSIPAFGLGIWQVPQEETARVVRESINMGYPLIDGAAAYKNEEQLGEGIRSSDTSRDDLFITSKVWNDGMDYDAVRRAVGESLKRIGLEKLDLMLIHWPFPKQDAYVDAWKALIAARDGGQVTSIGVCNFHEAHLKRIIDETGVAPVLNQIEVNPMLQQAKMLKVNAAHDIVTQSWSPLGNARSFDADPIKAVAERTGKTAPQVILRWHLQRGNAVIARSTKTDHLKANMAIFDFEITQAEMDAITKLEQGERTGPDPETFNGM